LTPLSAAKLFVTARELERGIAWTRDDIFFPYRCQVIFDMAVSDLFATRELLFDRVHSLPTGLTFYCKEIPNPCQKTVEFVAAPR
jgi:hypothetical protein